MTSKPSKINIEKKPEIRTEKVLVFSKSQKELEGDEDFSIREEEIEERERRKQLARDIGGKDSSFERAIKEGELLLAEQRKQEILDQLEITDKQTSQFHKTVLPNKEITKVDNFIELLPSKENKMSNVYR